MRVLVTGRAIPKQSDRCTGQQLAHGFREAGHECVFYGNFYGEPYRWLGAMEATTEKFDLIVITETNDGYPGLHHVLDHLNLADTPRLYWDFDVSYHEDVSFARAGAVRYDGYLVGNRYYVDRFAERFEKPSLHLPYACSPHIHKKLDDVQKGYTLGFIGSLTDERKRLIEIARDAAYNRADVHHAEGVFGDDLVRQTNAYRVMFHNNQDACKGLVPGRPWETTSCGTTLLMDRISYDDFLQFLPEHLHSDLYVYDDETDIRKWIREFSSRKASVELGGLSLMSHVQKHHSYTARAKQIVEWCKSCSIT